MAGEGTESTVQKIAQARALVEQVLSFSLRSTSSGTGQKYCRSESDVMTVGIHGQAQGSFRAPANDYDDIIGP